jgi:hypothetical protein
MATFWASFEWPKLFYLSHKLRISNHVLTDVSESFKCVLMKMFRTFKLSFDTAIFVGFWFGNSFGYFFQILGHFFPITLQFF